MIKTETTPTYIANQETKTIQAALDIIDQKLQHTDIMITSPDTLKKYLKLKIGNQVVEKFYTIYLTTRHEIISIEESFSGTIDSASVYPREILRAVIEKNAAAVIFAHNHPSGESKASNADIQITHQLKDALQLINVRVLDHIIIGKQMVSMAEQGLL